MANKKIAGTVYVRVDGEIIGVHGNVTLSVSDTERETVVGASGVLGYVERPAAPFVELDVADGQDVDWDALIGSTEVEVQAELATGRTAVFNNAWQVNQGELDAIEGQATLRWECETAAWRT